MDLEHHALGSHHPDARSGGELGTAHHPVRIIDLHAALATTDRAVEDHDAADELLRDPEKAKRMGHAARQTVEERFGVRRMTRELEAVYTEMLGNGSHGR